MMDVMIQVISDTELVQFRSGFIPVDQSLSTSVPQLQEELSQQPYQGRDLIGLLT